MTPDHVTVAPEIAAKMIVSKIVQRHRRVRLIEVVDNGKPIQTTTKKEGYCVWRERVRVGKSLPKQNKNVRRKRGALEIGRKSVAIKVPRDQEG
ncbi:hypothetical protein TNCV_2376101 [Trichonephila clavipes]|nr:hypothetical protein TNCV_2376101 [Trichonephila clavipes]